SRQEPAPTLLYTLSLHDALPIFMIPMINEAVFALNEGVASAEDIDAVMRLGASHPMGPLELADMIGLDTVLSIMEAMHHAFGDRSEEHTSELQSRENLVCRLLLE